MHRMLPLMFLLMIISYTADAKLNLNKDVPGGTDTVADGEQIFNQFFSVKSALEGIRRIESALDSFIKLTDLSRSTMTEGKLNKIGNTAGDIQNIGFWNWIGGIEGTIRKQEYQIKKLELRIFGISFKS